MEEEPKNIYINLPLKENLKPRDIITVCKRIEIIPNNDLEDWQNASTDLVLK